MKVRKGVVCIFLVALMSIQAFAVTSFSDVKPGSWYASYVDYVVEKGLMSGTSEKSFAPDKQVTRAEICQILYAMAGKPSVVEETYFEDLTQNWYKKAVIWAGNAGVTSGLDYKHFAPGNGVTREQAATFLRSYAKQVGIRNVRVDATLSAYKDASSVSSWAKDAVSWAVAKGLLKSASSKEMILNPKRIIKRSELATILTNYTKLEYPDPAEASQNLYTEIFADLEGRTFNFLSGAGAWNNYLEVQDNGEFAGYYHDTDAYGGNGYNATRVFCKYSGRFYIKGKKDDHTYVLGITNMKMENTPGASFISDHVLMIASSPYGLDNAEDIVLYLPGKPINDLSEEFLGWTRYGYDLSGGTLSGYGLYNVNEGQGWYGG